MGSKPWNFPDRPTGNLTKMLLQFFSIKTRGFGGGKRDRTDDLLHAMQALSQLSYTPNYLLTPPRNLAGQFLSSLEL